MKVSIVTADGTTTYSEIIDPVVTETENFSTVMNDASSQLNEKLTGVYSLEDIFREASETYNVDINLLTAIAKQESAFHPDATSSSGAQGIMQLMPATAQELGVKNAYDPYENIIGGAKLIRQLLDRYDGDVTLALAAYNAGSGNVAKYGGVPPFKETQNYVAKVTAYYQEGVTIPQATYTADTLSKKDAAANLDILFKDFPNHPSYSTFLEQMELLGANTEEDPTASDAQAAYRQLLSTANQAILRMLADEDGLT